MNRLMGFAGTLVGTGAGERPRSIVLVLAVLITAGSGFGAGLQAVGAILLAIGILGFVSLRFPRHVVLFLALYFPFEELILKYMPVPDQIYSWLRYGGEGLIYALFVAVIAKKLWQRSMRGTPLDVALALFVGITILSALANGTSAVETSLFLRSLLRYAFLFYVVANLDLSDRFSHQLVFVLLLTGLAQVAVGVAQIFGGDIVTEFLRPARASTLSVAGYSKEFLTHRELSSMSGTTGDTVTLAYFLMVTLSLSVAHGLFSPALRKVCYVATGVIFFLGIVLTYTRGTFLAAAAVVITLLVASRRWLAVTFLGLSILLSVTILSGNVSLPTTVRAANETQISPVEDFLQVFTPDYRRSASAGRLYVLLELSPMVLRSSPLFGFGPAFGPRQSQEFYLKDVYWTNMLFRVGVLGLMAFVLILAQLIVVAKRVYTRSRHGADKALALGSAGIVIGVALNNFFSPVSEIRTISLYFWLFAGLLVAKDRAHKSEVRRTDLSP